jgi:hypothetical protein
MGLLWRALVNSVMNFRVPYNAGKLPSGTQLNRASYLVVCAGLETALRCLLCRDEVTSNEGILFNHQLGPLAKVSLAFFFVVVPVVVAIWDYYGFLVCRDGLYFFLG